MTGLSSAGKMKRNTVLIQSTVPIPTEMQRICHPKKIANAIQQILINSISLPLPDLAKACAQVFGFTHMGSNIEASMLRGIQEAVKRNYAKVENGRATIID